MRQKKCTFCGVVKEYLTIDHVLPKALGGTDEQKNLIKICIHCNNNKSHLFIYSLVKKHIGLRYAKKLMNTHYTKLKSLLESRKLTKSQQFSLSKNMIELYNLLLLIDDNFSQTKPNQALLIQRKHKPKRIFDVQYSNMVRVKGRVFDSWHSYVKNITLGSFPLFEDESLTDLINSNLFFKFLKNKATNKISNPNYVGIIYILKNNNDKFLSIKLGERWLK